jgi:hypothetical protein
MRTQRCPSIFSWGLASDFDREAPMKDNSGRILSIGLFILSILIWLAAIYLGLKE